ncbi:hypothetical protein MNBD_ALPHA05-2500, partial [hydrothermal vent metagenome]
TFLSVMFLATACTTLQETVEQSGDRKWASDTTIQNVVENSDNNKWIRVVGWLQKWPFSTEAELFATAVGLGDSDAALDVPRIGIRLSELSARLPASYQGKKVLVTGKVDTRCPVTHAEIEQDMKEDLNIIIMAAGYCHYTDLIHLDHAVVELAKE